MYTLLVLLACLSSSLLLEIIRQNQRNISPARPVMAAYILTTALMLYTHYFSAFLLPAHALILLFGSAKSGRGKPLLLQAMALFGGTALLFAPWMPVLPARLGDDPSYWAGTLKLAEVVQDIFISFAVGGKREMILEADGLRFAAGFAALLLLSLILLLAPRSNASRRHSVLFLLAWLVIPTAFTIGMSYQTPKFNPRYTLIAWPAFALLISAGLETLIRRRAVNKLLLAALAGFVIFSATFSLRNWFDPRPPFDQFAKADFKHVAQFIRERSSPGDTVLLSSGHFFPVWEYYAGPENWTPLPRMETLDVNRVTGFEIIPALQTALAGKSGAWLVTWQDEVIDPNGVVPLLLDTSAQRLEDDFHRGDFIGVGLHYWRLPPALTFPADFPAQIRPEATFSNGVRLRGLLQPPNNQDEVVLFWEASRPLTEDYLISLRLVDADGVTWSEPYTARPANYRYPTPRWQPGRIVAGQHHLRRLPGTPPGQYQLEVGWLTAQGQGLDVLDQNGNPLRRTVLLGPITFSQPAAAELPAGATLTPFGPLGLVQADFTPADVETGGKTTLDALWQTGAVSTAAITLTGWIDQAGQTFPLDAPPVIPAHYPANMLFRARLRLSTPFAAAPGTATLLAEVLPGQTRPVANVTLLPTQRNFAPPARLDFVSGANFNDQALLLGGTTDNARPATGQAVTITLYWQAKKPFAADYTVFAHLLGANGAPVLNADHVLPRPTANWVEGEIVADAVLLSLPADLPPGSYPLEVGLYNPADPALARLPLQNSAQTYTILTTLEVSAP